MERIYQLSTFVEKEVAEKVGKLATADHRSISSWIRVLLFNDLKKREGQT